MVYQQLAQLIRDAVWLKSYIAAGEQAVRLLLRGVSMSNSCLPAPRCAALHSAYLSAWTCAVRLLCLLQSCAWSRRLFPARTTRWGRKRGAWT